MVLTIGEEVDEEVRMGTKSLEVQPLPRQKLPILYLGKVSAQKSLLDHDRNNSRRNTIDRASSRWFVETNQKNERGLDPVVIDKIRSD